MDRNYSEVSTIRKYSFNDGTNIFVKVDFENNKVSFVEKNGGQYVSKKWLFAERGAEFMNGWHNILSAMQFVALEVKKDLEAYQEKKKQQAIELAALILDEREKK